MVSTLRKNKRDIPVSITDHKDRDLYSSVFLFLIKFEPCYYSELHSC